MLVILGIGLVILGLFAVVGNISNSRQLGRRIWSNRLLVYILLLIAGIVLIFAPLLGI